MHPFLVSAAGGALIGAAATLLMLGAGRVAGVSGIFGGLLVPAKGDVAWRAMFVLGLLVPGVVAMVVRPAAIGAVPSQPLAVTAAAGLLVGAGTWVGNGCTSGHGVCGISRGSLRSVAATVTFIVTGGLTVFAASRLLGLGR
jgi:uncharacterized membrane protein YedE/YeeE